MYHDVKVELVFGIPSIIAECGDEVVAKYIDEQDREFFGRIFSGDIKSIEYKDLPYQSFSPQQEEEAKEWLAENFPERFVKDIVKELVDWAKSVEGQKVSKGITDKSDIFERARKYLKKVGE